MKKVPIGKNRNFGFKTFKWGLYLHLRWKLSYYHSKISVWRQSGLRASTRRQVSKGRKPRYVQAFRLQISIWSTKAGKQCPPRVYGVMFYGGTTKS